MKVTDHKLGRIFHLHLAPGDDLRRARNNFVKEKRICSGSVFIFGASQEMDMVSGFKTMEGYHVDRRHFDDWRELIGLRNNSPDLTRRLQLSERRFSGRSCSPTSMFTLPRAAVQERRKTYPSAICPTAWQKAECWLQFTS